MGEKLGVQTAEADDLALLTDFLALLQRTHADYTRTFRALSRYAPADPATLAPLQAEVNEAEGLDAWLAKYTARLAREGSVDTARHARMLGVNPKYVLRNWVAQEVITNAEARNYGKIEEVRQLLASPFEEHPAFEHYAAAPPEWAQHIAVSCSS